LIPNVHLDVCNCASGVTCRTTGSHRIAVVIRITWHHLWRCSTLCSYCVWLHDALHYNVQAQHVNISVAYLDLDFAPFVPIGTSGDDLSPSGINIGLPPILLPPSGTNNSVAICAVRCCGTRRLGPTSLCRRHLTVHACSPHYFVMGDVVSPCDASKRNRRWKRSGQMDNDKITANNKQNE